MILAEVLRQLAPAECKCRRDDTEQDAYEDKNATETSNKHEQGLTHGKRPNDPSSATRRMRTLNCNRWSPAGFAAAHG